MTAQMIDFPGHSTAVTMPAIDVARSIANAREALREPEGYGPEQMKDICLFLMEWGDAADMVHAETMLMLVSRPPRPTLTDYRAEWVPVLVFFGVFLVWLVLFLAVTP